MTKVEVRLPQETYAYINLQYDSMEEYIEKYPTDALSIAKAREQAQKKIIDWKGDQIPFENNLYSKKKI